MNSRLLVTLSATMLLAFAGSAARAQDRGNDQGRHDQDRYGQDRHDQDRYDQNRRDQDRHDHDRFDDHDRQVAREWYNQHRDHRPRGFRDRDRLSPEYENRFQSGVVLDRDMRRRIHSVPGDLYRRLPPPPRGYRYVVIGGHIVLVDNGYRVHDVIHFELNF